METIISFIQGLYNFLQIEKTANAGDFFGLISVIFLVGLSLINLFGKKEKPELSAEEVEAEKIEEVAEEKPTVVKEAVPVEEVKVVSWKERLQKGFARSRSQVWGKLESLISGSTLDEDVLDEIEEILYGADIGPVAVAELLDELRKNVGNAEFKGDEFKKFLYQFLQNKMADAQAKVNTELYDFTPGKGLKTVMVVGVNGAGKTTTIGKLATKLTRQGAKVVVGACDTFRAAAVDQLEVWCERAGATMIRAKEGTNPSGVAYEALEKAQAMEADYCILDTAGRLHTKGNLMDELAKNKRVLAKLDDSAPQEVLLVIDAITGQNAMRQAEEFHKTLGLTGLIFTKCDGSSKAGSAVGIVQKLQVPISYIGVGETVEDLNVFSLDEYLGTLLDISAV